MRSLLSAIILLLALLAACAQSQPPATGTAPPAVTRQLLASGVENFRVGRYDEARRLFTEAIIAARGMDDAQGMALATVNMAETALAMGSDNEAVTLLRQARHLMDREGFPDLGPRLDLVAANLAIHAGQPAEAVALLTPYLPAAKPRVGQELQLAALASRVQLAFASDEDPGPWTERYGQAVADLAPDQPRAAALRERFAARLSYRDDDSTTGDRHFGAAVALYRRDTARAGLAATLTEWGQRLMAVRRWQAGRDRLDRALFVRAEMEDRHGLDQVLNLLDQLDQASGDQKKASETRQWRTVVTTNPPSTWRSLLVPRKL